MTGANSGDTAWSLHCRILLKCRETTKTHESQDIALLVVLSLDEILSEEMGKVLYDGMHDECVIGTIT